MEDLPQEFAVLISQKIFLCIFFVFWMNSFKEIVLNFEQFCFVLFPIHKVRIKSIQQYYCRTPFCSGLYVLLSDSIQNILITFGPEKAFPVSFNVHRGSINSTSCGLVCQIYLNFIIHGYKTNSIKNVVLRNFDILWFFHSRFSSSSTIEAGAGSDSQYIYIGI